MPRLCALLPPAVDLAARIALTCLLLRVLYRAAFWGLFRRAARGVPRRDLLCAVGLGLRFDLRLALLLAPPALLLSWLPFIKGFTVFYWATGTCWIPMLVVLAVWRHVYRRFPLKYDPLYWGAVFPLGMYAASTHEMIAAMGFDFLVFLPPVFLYIGLAAWTAAFCGFAFDLLRRPMLPACGEWTGASHRQTKLLAQAALASAPAEERRQGRYRAVLVWLHCSLP